IVRQVPPAGTFRTRPSSGSYNLSLGMGRSVAGADFGDASLLVSRPPPIVLTDVADTTIRDGTAAATNFGTLAQLTVKTSDPGYNRISYLRFDLNVLGTSPTGTISRATLRLLGTMSDTRSPGAVTGV